MNKYIVKCLLKTFLVMFLMVIGFWLIGDVKLGVGIFLLLWGNNIK